MHQKKKPNKQNFVMMHELIFGDNNTRYDELYASIEANGFLRNYPLLIFAEDVIGCGHRRRLVALKQDIQQVPAIITDIEPASPQAQIIMIEDNLRRPMQCREFSPLEQYMLAMRLKELYGKTHGGDRRSERFLASKRGDTGGEHKISEIARIVGMCPRYQSMLSLVTNEIIDKHLQNDPDLRNAESHFDRIRIALDKNLDACLTALARPGARVYKIYDRFKSESKNGSPQSNKLATGVSGQADTAFNAVAKSIRKYYEVKFGDVVPEAMDNLSEPPQDPVKQLKLIRKVIDLVIEGARVQKKKKVSDNAEPLLFPDTWCQGDDGPGACGKE
jgi:hypothetical protein